jgi:hypothetical protein
MAKALKVTQIRSNTGNKPTQRGRSARSACAASARPSSTTTRP